MVQEGTFGRLLYAVHIDDQGIEHDVYVKTVTGKPLSKPTNHLWLRFSSFSLANFPTISLGADHASSQQLSMMLHESLNFHGLSHRNISCISALCQSESAPPLLVYANDGYTNLKRYVSLHQYRAILVPSIGNLLAPQSQLKN